MSYHSVMLNVSEASPDSGNKWEILRLSYHSVMLNVSEASPDSGNKWEILRLRSG